MPKSAFVFTAHQHLKLRIKFAKIGAAAKRGLLSVLRHPHFTRMGWQIARPRTD